MSPSSNFFSDSPRGNTNENSLIPELSHPTQSTTSASLSASDSALLLSITNKYPQFTFKPGQKFLFRPPHTIHYVIGEKNFRFLLLHELAHALLGHFSYQTSLERLKIERDAWDYTRSLCSEEKIPVLETVAEAELDTSRNWVHQKTLCKKCGLSCIEVNKTTLFCPKCQKTYERP